MSKVLRGRPPLLPDRRRKIVAIRLPPELLKQIRKKAREENTTLTALVERGLRALL